MNPKPDPLIRKPRPGNPKKRWRGYKRARRKAKRRWKRSPKYWLKEELTPLPKGKGSVFRSCPACNIRFKIARSCPVCGDLIPWDYYSKEIKCQHWVGYSHGPLLSRSTIYFEMKVPKSIIGLIEGFRQHMEIRFQGPDNSTLPGDAAYQLVNYYLRHNHDEVIWVHQCLLGHNIIYYFCQHPNKLAANFVNYIIDEGKVYQGSQRMTKKGLDEMKETLEELIPLMMLSPGAKGRRE